MPASILFLPEFYQIKMESSQSTNKHKKKHQKEKDKKER